jgi:hypothetical protein
VEYWWDGPCGLPHHYGAVAEGRHVLKTGHLPYSSKPVFNFNNYCNTHMVFVNGTLWIDKPKRETALWSAVQT